VVLVIEADEAYRATIDACATLAGCTTEHADGAHVVQALEERPVDVIVWGAARAGRAVTADDLFDLRLHSDAAVVLLDHRPESAQTDLEAGADQWLAKPFDPGRLVGTLHAALRQAQAAVPRPSRREIGGLLLDGPSRRLQVAGREVFLTRQEWNLLTILAEHPNRFLSAREILRLGWHAGYHAADEIRTYVRRLRQKLAGLNAPCSLVSEHGRGYRLTFE
jgi:two-component system KDP operon response regulator KdpE